MRVRPQSNLRVYTRGKRLVFKKNLYVITHKEIKNIFPKSRKIMMVGAINKEVPQGYYSDYGENCDNISSKNANYCELTGLYYMIKNDTDVEVLGLEHYRRLFTKRKFYLFKFPFLKSKDIDKILETYDVIVPKIATLPISIYDHYAKDHIEDDLIKTKEIIKRKYPKYVDICEKVLSGNEIYFCNMFIGKKEVIQDYANFLFDMLFELERQIKDEVDKRDAYQRRVYGFLSERLFTIWLKAQKDIKIYECRMEVLDGSPFKTMMNKVGRKIKKIFSNSGEK